jgi:hypothetical protein
MARIMCTQNFWRALRRSGRPPVQVDEPLVQDAILGNWAAKVFKVDGRDLVLALNERTYLTVVFPLAPRDGFRSRFGEAVRTALQDLGVPLHSRVAESSAVEIQPLVRLTDRSLVSVLNDLQFFCEIELGYHADLRTVQYNLNQAPHAGLSPCVPAEAVAELFDGVSGRGAVLLKH